MKLLILLCLIPVAFADETFSIHVPAIEKFASAADLKKAGIAKLKPAQLDALNDIIDQIALQVAQDTADQIANELEKQSDDDGGAVKTIPLTYHGTRK